MSVANVCKTPAAPASGEQSTEREALGMGCNPLGSNPTTLRVRLRQVGGCWDATIIGQPMASGMHADPHQAALMAARRGGHPGAIYHGFRVSTNQPREADVFLTVPTATGGRS
jgi:hypothetical protein